MIAEFVLAAGSFLGSGLFASLTVRGPKLGEGLADAIMSWLVVGLLALNGCTAIARVVLGVST